MKSLIRNVALVALYCTLASSIAFAQYNNARPRDGACFFTDYNFRGQSFCLNEGQDASTIPSGFNDRIRSIRVFGRARVQFFNDSNYRGVSGTTTRDISDLRRLPLPDVRSKNWETRISSIQLSTGGFGGGHRGDRDDDRGGWNGGNDRDHDRDNHYGNNNQTISCNSDPRSQRDYCRTPGRVNNARLINQSGMNKCEWNRTYGIDNGRLWTAHGCSGTFEVR